MKTLFNLSDFDKELPKTTCRTCEHRQRWDFNGKVFQYCGIRKSNRTSNGLLKIRCKDLSCDFYKEDKL